MILKILVLFLLKRSECSIVVDSYDQKGIYLSDYCPQMEYCPEGAHVMCMYYHPDRVMGPRCSNPQNITITPALANQLLDITNAIRSKIATGRETGFNGTSLPRGYGIFRLKWDNELATFAQVLANQCVLRHDLCRATKRFPNPGQAAGLVRFSYPDWNPISRMSSNPPPGLDDSKMAFSVTQTLKSWYMKKAFVTPEMIEHYPVYTSTQNSGGKLYLETVHGPATHMGCGMSAYSEFAFYDTLYSMNYNSIQVICNFSSRPKPGEMTFATVPEPGSSRCGCPVGTQEDSDCLCSEIEYKPEKPTVTDMGIQAEPDTCQQSDNCEPTLVLLPIFTVEDAPSQKLVERTQNIREPLSKYVLQRLANRSDILQKSLTMNMEDIFGNNIQQLPGRQHLAMPLSLKTVLGQPDHAELRSLPQQKRAPQSPRLPPRHTIAKKSSIFTKVDRFNLPNNKKRFSRYQPAKSIVKPRKDFKNMERVVNDYFKHRDDKNHQVVANKQQNIKANTFGPLIEEKPETYTKKSVEKGIELDHILKQKDNASIEDVDTNYEDDDKKLMNLLNTLEKEVKNIELDGSKKEIFDAKIRKIYGSVIGNSDLLLPSKPKSILKLKSKSKPSAHVEHIEPELFEHDFKGSKSYSKHESKHKFYDDLRNSLDSNHLSEGNRHNYEHDVDKKNNHGKKHDHFDHYNDNFDEKPNTKAYNKYVDELENESFNDHELSDVDQKLFADIEQKYNDRLAAYELNKLDPKFNDNEDHKFIDKVEHKYNNNFDGEYNEIAMHHYPKSRQQHNIAKNANIRKIIHENDENKHRDFENYRNGQPRNTHYNTNRIHFRNGDDIKFGKEEADINWNKEFEQEDPLSAERRKYYHEKLEALRSQLRERSLRLKHHERVGERITPRIRPNRANMDRTITKTHRDSIYVPDRARFLHGF